MRRNWTRGELLVALKIYCELEFGQFHARHPRIIEVADKLGRSHNSLAMKLCNFASLDPAMLGKGLKGASKADAEIIRNYLEYPEQLILQSEETYEKLIENQGNFSDFKIEAAAFEYEITERLSNVKTRTVQSFFRTTVISSYYHKCAICSLDMNGLLIASHIIPWSSNAKLRANPMNGISLCSLHDKAFDKGYIAIDKEHQVIIGKDIKKRQEIPIFSDGFLKYENQKINLPFRFMPDSDCLEYHRDTIFHG